MDSSEKKRKLLIGAALVATLLAAVMVEKEEAEDDSVKTVEPTQIPRTSKERAAQKQENITEALDVSKLGQRKFNPKAGELFVTTNWAPKPPPIDPEEQAAREKGPGRAAWKRGRSSPALWRLRAICCCYTSGSWNESTESPTRRRIAAGSSE